jgi:hypothetical protein
LKNRRGKYIVWASGLFQIIALLGGLASSCTSLKSRFLICELMTICNIKLMKGEPRRPKLYLGIYKEWGALVMDLSSISQLMTKVLFHRSTGL